MKNIETQMTLEDVSDEYKQFVEKFKPKKTTDDCYTPDNIYEAVKEWACKEYGIDPKWVVRPFWPGGNYERFEYMQGSVVIDNPPFSIISPICAHYNEREIPFFLFAPYLTNLFIGGEAKMDICHIVTNTNVTYENGAVVNTAFVTNMDPMLARSCPELREIIDREEKKNLAKIKKKVPKYSYPDEVLTATMLGYMSAHGVEFSLKRDDASSIRGLDSQKSSGKAIFGGGYLLSEKAAAEKAAAEKAAAEKAAAEKENVTIWELSDREREIIKSLGG